MRWSEKSDVIKAAIVAAQHEAGYFVSKDADNPFHKSRYASLEAVTELTAPVLANHGLGMFHEFPPVLGGEHNTVLGCNATHTVVHGESGQWVEFGPYFLPTPPGKNNTAQGFTALQSYGRRGGQNCMFALAAPDDDGNEASGKGKAKAVEDPKAAREAFWSAMKDRTGGDRPGQWDAGINATLLSLYRIKPGEDGRASEYKAAAAWFAGLSDDDLKARLIKAAESAKEE